MYCIFFYFIYFLVYDHLKLFKASKNYINYNINNHYYYELV